MGEAFALICRSARIRATLAPVGARRIVAASIALALGTTATAAAQDDVFVDPDSPTGKEYAIPLEEARRNAGASGPPDRIRPGERSAELFGAGVGDGQEPPEVGEGAAGRAREGGRERQGAASGRQAPAKRRRESSGGVPAPAARSATADGGDGDLLLVGAIGIGALALGALLGIAGRRRLGSG